MSKEPIPKLGLQNVDMILPINSDFTKRPEKKYPRCIEFEQRVSFIAHCYINEIPLPSNKK